MGRNKMPIAVVICVGLVAMAFVAGCHGALFGVHGGKARVQPKPVFVDLDALLMHNPNYRLVRQTDAALGVYARILGSAKPIDSLPEVSPGEQFSPESLSLDERPGYSESELASRLEESGTQWLETLKTRLSTANQLAAAEAARVARVEGESRFEALRDQINERENRAILMILPGDADKRINLNLKIGALSKHDDPRNPRTGPQEYFDQLLQGRRDDLSSLDARLEANMQQAARVQVEELVKLRQTTDEQTAAKIAEGNRQAQERIDARVAEATMLLSERKDSILSTARAFDQQMIGALTVDVARPAPAIEGSGAPMTNAAAIGGWNARIARTVNDLRDERSRQMTLVREETRRTVLDMAMQDHLLVVGWSPRQSGADYTQTVLRELRTQGWTQ
ncbi:MAG: hypothetical protein P4L33_01240 [Capsulimonadaceae bacterium]|nr:hypothetical protein [Capsulimonadaceae bacterium]